MEGKLVEDSSAWISEINSSFSGVYHSKSRIVLREHIPLHMEIIKDDNKALLVKLQGSVGWQVRSDNFHNDVRILKKNKFLYQMNYSWLSENQVEELDCNFILTKERFIELFKDIVV